eukprot:EG_transcript_11556
MPWRWLLRVGRADSGVLRQRLVPGWTSHDHLPHPLREGTAWVALANVGSETSLPEEQVRKMPKASGRRGRPADHRELSAAVQEHFEKYGIDVTKVLRRYPPFVSHGVERVQRITSYLAGLGVDVKRAVEADSRVLAGKVEKYETVVGLLRANGVDVARVVTRNPGVLKRRVATMKRTMAAIKHCGHSVADMVDCSPNILRSTEAGVSCMLHLQNMSTVTKDERSEQLAPATPDMDPRVTLLFSLGLDSHRLLRKAPHALNLSLDKLQTMIKFLAGLRVDTPKVLQRAPVILSLRVEALQERVRFLSENRLDVERHVNSCPTLLCCSVEQNLQPTLTFVLQEMGCTLADVDEAPVIWGCSLEGRLRPRFLYLMSLGRKPPKLTRLAIPADKVFATQTAGKHLHHYYDWRLQNGYSVPRSHASSGHSTSKDNATPITG